MRTVYSVSEAIDLAKAGEQSMVTCPAHEDNNASLHVAPGHKQPVVMTCHAGCTVEHILLEGRVDPQSILAPRDPNWEDSYVGDDKVWTPAGDASHRYIYTDEEGTELYEVLRIPLPNGDKTFRQRHPDPSKASGYNWSMEGVRRVLYNLPEVLAAKVEGRTIWFVEGEKDVETLRKQGVTATTVPMGAGPGKWSEEFADVLAGADVAIIADADTPGRAHARRVRESLEKKGCTVRNYEAMTGHKDATDHFSAGGTFESLIETRPAQEAERDSYGVDVLSVIKRTFSPKSYVIPGTLARGDRMVMTGWEGHGKSTLLGQIAVQVAAGIHPWTGMEMPPQKVLNIDSENHPDQVLERWQNLVGLAARHGRPIQPGALTILEEWDTDLDLTSEEGHEWLQERVRAYTPDLVCMGPLYNLSSRDLRENDAVHKIKTAVNEARGICGTAFIMEHHAPHRQVGESKRSVRPYGSSTFLKWPEFGYGLLPVDDNEGFYEFQKTRMPRVRSRNFPEYMRWGKQNTLEWPWMVCSEEEAIAHND